MPHRQIGPLSDQEQRFVRVVELFHPARFMSPFQWAFLGRKPQDRLPIAKAFIAKVVWNFTTTRALLDYLENCPSLRRLCLPAPRQAGGWETVAAIPSESTFSRAFAAFAAFRLPEQIHAAMVQENCGPKLVGHVPSDVRRPGLCRAPDPAAFAGVTTHSR